jgi:hypothetical protein
MKQSVRAAEMVLRVRGEFLEMPGLRLTQAQAQRLWGLDATTCSSLITSLLDAGFLFQTRDGAFMRIERSGAADTSVGPGQELAAAV